MKALLGVIFASVGLIGCSNPAMVALSEGKLADAQSYMAANKYDEKRIKRVYDHYCSNQTTLVTSVKDPAKRQLPYQFTYLFSIGQCSFIVQAAAYDAH